MLVVDDEPNIAELVATALRYEGFEVMTAADGAGALAAVRDLAPDLVVLDVMLPDADGFELQARIRRDGQHVPVLFLTARDAVEDRVRGLTFGADDYMTKPFSLEELVARVHAVLRRTSGEGASLTACRSPIWSSTRRRGRFVVAAVAFSSVRRSSRSCGTCS